MPIAAATLMLGANDCCNSRSLQHVPISDFETNMTTIVRHLQGLLQPGGKVLLIAPPAADEARWAQTLRTRFKVPGDGRSASSMEPYAEAIRRIAKAEGCVLVDVNKAMPLASGLGPSKGLSDGLHFDERGNDFVYKQVLMKLEEAGFAPNDLQQHMPHYLHKALPEWFDYEGAKAKAPSSVGAVRVH